LYGDLFTNSRPLGRKGQIATSIQRAVRAPLS
jgi:hypothetical protein